MTLTVLNGPIIQKGESLSDGVDCSGGDVVRITMPAGWSGGMLTFQISTDGFGYNNLHDINGDEIAIEVVPGAAVRIDREWATFWNFVKFRSGTAKTPVVQPVQRDFAVALSVRAEGAPPSGTSLRGR